MSQTITIRNLHSSEWGEKEEVEAAVEDEMNWPRNEQCSTASCWWAIGDVLFSSIHPSIDSLQHGIPTWPIDWVTDLPILEEEEEEAEDGGEKAKKK